MNQRQYKAASHLPREELNKDNKAFFKSVLGTLNHIMVGDIIWLKRFGEHRSNNKLLSYVINLKKPVSLNEILFNELDELKQEREKIDKIIIDWVDSLSQENINGCITYTNMKNETFNKPFASVLNHLFLHQVHHRGQVTTLLSQYGVDFGKTDLIEIIDECTA